MKNIIKIILINILVCNYVQAQDTFDTAYTAPKIEDTLVNRYKDGMIAWLKKIVTPATPIRNKMVKDILKNAEFDKMYYTDSRKRSVYVPLKKSYFSQHISKSAPMPFQSMFFTLDSQGKLIEGGNIDLVYPADKSLKELPKNTFQNFYSQYGTLDGTYILIGIFMADNKIIEMDIKGGERVEVRSWNPNKTNDESREWTLQTDIIANGTIIKTTTKSLGVSNTVSPPQFKGDKRPAEIE